MSGAVTSCARGGRSRECRRLQESRGEEARAMSLMGHDHYLWRQNSPSSWTPLTPRGR